MASTEKPKTDLAKKTLPPALLLAIEHIFSQASDGCVLVGGTALAGFYAGHRRSDDIDIFTRDTVAQKASVLAVKSLVEIGAKISGPRESPQYFHCLAELKRHKFTVDVVLDQNIFDVELPLIVDRNISVLSLEGLLKCKLATLVSRCSEKDLYDLIWLFDKFPEVSLSDAIALGKTIDAGFSGEGLLLSLTGADTNKEACGFSEPFGVPKDAVFTQITKFKKHLLENFSKMLHENKQSSHLGDVIKALKKL